MINSNACKNEASRENILEIPEYAIGKIVSGDSKGFLKMFELKSRNPFDTNNPMTKRRIILKTFYSAHKLLSNDQFKIIESIIPQNISNPTIFGPDPLKIAVLSSKKIYVLTFESPFYKENELYFRSFKFQQVFPETPSEFQIL